MTDEFLAGEKATAEKLSRRGIKVAATISADIPGIGAGPTTLTGFTTGSFAAVANRIYRISINATGLVNTSASAWQIHCHLDGVSIGRLCPVEGAAGERVPINGFVISTPSAGAHTWTAVSTRYGGAGTLDIQCAAGINGYFVLEDCGPV